MENQLLECLEVITAAGDDERARLSRVARSIGYDELPKSWKGLARIAVSKMGPKGAEDNDGPIRPVRRSGRRSARSRKGRSPVDDVIANTEEGNAGYRLCRLLLISNSDSDVSESNIESVRNECEKGLHPVWERLAREAPIFAELSRFPVKEQEESVGDIGFWSESSKFDPLNHKQVASWLSIEPPFSLSSSQRRALNALRKEYSSKVSVKRVKEHLSNVEDGGELEDFLYGIIGASIGENVVDRLEGAIKNETIKEVAEMHLILNRMRYGIAPNEISSWLSKDGIDPLTSSIVLESWKRIDLEGVDLDIESLLSGGALLDLNNEKWPPALSSKIASLLIGDERYDEAVEILVERTIDARRCLILGSGIPLENSSLNSVIEDSVKRLESDELDELLKDESLPIPVRVSASRALIQRKDISYSDSDLADVLTLGCEIELLAEILVENKVLESPLRGLLVWHLLPAHLGMDHYKEILSLRRASLSSLKIIEDECISDVSIALMSIMNGFSKDLSVLHELLGSKGVIELNQTRRALLSEGSGIVKESILGHLSKSSEKASMNEIERGLFRSLITSLRLNRARVDLHMQTDEKRRAAISSLSSIMTSKSLSMETVTSVSEIVEEHNLPIQELDDWYRKHAPDAISAQIVKAAIWLDKGDHRNAGRAFKEAANRSEGFESRTGLNRKALIQLAHARAWKDAVDLIERNEELLAAITNRFQLFLRVCNEYEKGEKDTATALIVKYVKDSSKEMSDELSTLESYSSELGLPSEPFEGRVKAAIKRLERSGRRGGVSREDDWKDALNHAKTVIDVDDIATQQAEVKPLAGLRVFQTAIRSGFFDDKDVKRLRQVLRIKFTELETSIPVRDRKSFDISGLKPLVIVDTNILIQAFKDELLSKVSSDGFGQLAWSMERAFQWELRRRGNDGDIILYVPSAVQGEFVNRTRSLKSVRSLFDGEYQDQVMWSKIEDGGLEEIQKHVIGLFNRVSISFKPDPDLRDGITEFLVKHEGIFERIDEKKRILRDDEPARSVISGRAIYPEAGDLKIMLDAANLASFTSTLSSNLKKIGSVHVATRDSDFRMIRRALEESYGFSVVSDAGEVSKLVPSQ
uniref:PIN domain-containing protein n=1 Tax=uncultured organism HF70_19B12 TaxID=357602 RepID=Q2Q0F5_9ZZZZ|nr:hypothetical protein [uncultured organism HF70_19B12]